MSDTSIWDPAERSAWRVPEVLSHSEWAQRNRILTRRQSSRPGHWDNANAPPLKGIMDLCGRRGIHEIAIKKAAQVGVSEAIRNVIGSRATQHPDPMLIVLPNEQIGRKIVSKRLLPLFQDTAILAELATHNKHDAKLTSILLSNGFDLQLAWAGSPAALASDPICWVIFDETDKYPEFSGREASPIDLGRVRTRTYGDRRLVILISTPTTRAGIIHQCWESSPIKLWYYVPCPHARCGASQRLVFDLLKWEPFRELKLDAQRADRIRNRQAAWYQCAKCAGRIDESHKRSMLLAGYWGTEDGAWKLYFDGREAGRFPEGDRVGIHLSALYDLSTRFADIAAETVEAAKDPVKLMHLRNSTQAEVFEQPISTPTLSVFARKCRPDPESGFVPPPAKVVPRWASRLVMTADTQKDHFWFVIRAWGFGFRSQRIHHGRATSFDELRELFTRAYFPYAPDPDGSTPFAPLRCHMLGIDSGGGKMGLDRSRTDEVYQFCLSDPNWIKPLKGMSKAFDQPIRVGKVTYTPINKSQRGYEVWLFKLDTGYYQDVLASQIDATTPVIDRRTGEVLTEDLWQLNDLDDGEYNRHLSNMHKVRVGAKGHAEMWVPKTEGARVDYRDCEVYNLAMADGPAKCRMLPTADDMLQQIQLQQRQQQAPRTIGLRTPDGRPFLATQR